MTEDKHIEKEVQKVLSTSKDQISLERIGDEHTSPLNSPVIEKDIGGEKGDQTQIQDENWNLWKPKSEGEVSELETEIDFKKQAEQQIENEKKNEPLDAPEQQINGDYNDMDEQEHLSDTEFEMPLSQANQTADALLGITNNILSAGGSFIVKIKKHQEFYEFDQIVDVIDQQNEKNIKRIVLDNEDKTLLRPLLSQVIRKKAKQLTPEQQLMGAVASIMIKKGQTVMEIRAENKILENRLLTIIKEQKEAPEVDIASQKGKEDFSQSQTFENGGEFSAQQFDTDDKENQIITDSNKNENSIIEYADQSEDK